MLDSARRRAVSDRMTPTTDHPGRRRPRRRLHRGGPAGSSDRGLAVAFISPALLLLLAMSVFPLLWALYLSFTDYSATRDVPANFVGFQNYIDILTSAAGPPAGPDDADLRRRRGRPADRARLRASPT